MPMKQGTNNVAAALSVIRKAAPGADKKFRDKPAEISGGMLPAGLRGIAKLSGFKLAVKDDGFYKGKGYVAFRGVVKKCTDGQGNDYRGSLFYHEIVFADGRGFGKKPGKKAVDKVDAAMNTMKLLGLDLSNSTYDDWPTLMEEAIDNVTHFHFRTWAMPVTKTEPSPRVNAEIVRVAEGYTDDEATEDVVDNTETEVVSEEEEESETQEEGEVEEGAEGTEESPDYEALAETADSKDKKRAKEAEEAASVIQEAAKERGVDFEAYGSWAEVVEAMNSESSEAEEQAEEAETEVEQEEPAPSKGDVVSYKPIDPKTKKLVKKAVECEVIKVYGPKKKADLKNLENGKTVYKDVSWDRLAL